MPVDEDLAYGEPPGPPRSRGVPQDEGDGTGERGIVGDTVRKYRKGKPVEGFLGKLVDAADKIGEKIEGRLSPKRLSGGFCAAGAGSGSGVVRPPSSSGSLFLFSLYALHSGVRSDSSASVPLVCRFSRTSSWTNGVTQARTNTASTASRRPAAATMSSGTSMEQGTFGRCRSRSSGRVSRSGFWTVRIRRHAVY